MADSSFGIEVSEFRVSSFKSQGFEVSRFQGFEVSETNEALLESVAGVLCELIVNLRAGAGAVNSQIVVQCEIRRGDGGIVPIMRKAAGHAGFRGKLFLEFVAGVLEGISGAHYPHVKHRKCREGYPV